MSSLLNSVPSVFGTHAEWVVHDADDKTYTLYQAGPAIYSPVDLIRFVHVVASRVMEAAEKSADQTEAGIDAYRAAQVIVPPGRSAIDPGVKYSRDALAGKIDRRPAARYGPISRELWFRFPELNASADAFMLRKNARSKIRPKTAARWEVWAVGRGAAAWFQHHPGCELALTFYDRDGVPDPNFTFDRMPPAEMAEFLEARDKLKEAFKL
jgi:hypothetical protein